MMSTYEIIDGVYKGPEVFEGDLDLRYTQVKDLGNLKEVGRSLYLKGSQVKDLGNLKTVGVNLYLRDTQIISLGCLKSVVGCLYLPDSTKIENFKSYKKEAETFLKEIKPLDYPLHMNHENWIIRTRIDKYLETGEV